MMTKARKKIASFLVATALLCPMCVASAYADSEDTGWSMTSSTTDFKYLGASREKDNSSAVYFKMKTSVTSNKVDVKVLGTDSQPVTGWGQLHNCTVKNGIARNYAKCTKGVNYSLHSTVYESGYTYVTLAMTTAKNEKITGVWSADSKNTWNEATYY